jgi:hypothetical protein
LPLKVRVAVAAEVAGVGRDLELGVAGVDLGLAAAGCLVAEEAAELAEPVEQEPAAVARAAAEICGKPVQAAVARAVVVREREQESGTGPVALPDLVEQAAEPDLAAGEQQEQARAVGKLRAASKGSG